MNRRIEDLTHIVTVRADAGAGQLDARGMPVRNWVTVCKFFAHRKGLKGSLFFQAAMASHEDDELFTTYWRADLAPGMILIDGPVNPDDTPAPGSELFQVKVPPTDPDGSRMWLEIHARRVTAGGG